MRKVILLVLSVAVAYFTIMVNDVRAEENKWTRLIAESGMVLDDVQQMPDQSIPRDLLRSCSAIAIFPSTLSGGFGIGGKYGQGVIMVRNQTGNGWSPPAIFSITGASFGWQIGGQATDFILLMMGRRAIDGLLQGKFKLGADASIAAGPVGRAADVATDIQLKGGILSYSRSRGLFAGAKLEGDVITQHWDGNQAIYGRRFSAREILLENKTKVPKCADNLLRVLNRYPPKR